MPQVANDSASIVSCASCMPHHHTTLLRVKTTPTATPRRLALYLATCRSRAMSSERMGAHRARAAHAGAGSSGGVDAEEHALAMDVVGHDLDAVREQLRIVLERAVRIATDRPAVVEVDVLICARGTALGQRYAPAD